MIDLMINEPIFDRIRAHWAKGFVHHVTSSVTRADAGKLMTVNSERR